MRTLAHWERAFYAAAVRRPDRRSWLIFAAVGRGFLDEVARLSLATPQVLTQRRGKALLTLALAPLVLARHWAHMAPTLPTRNPG
jgi:hypothetical protein